MKRFLRSIIACICGMTIVFSSAVPLAFARDGVIGGVVDGIQSFTEWGVNNLNNFWKVIFGPDFNSASEEELKTAYDNYVSALPAQGYDSSGGLLWSPKLIWFGSGYTTFQVFCPHYNGSTQNSLNRWNVTFDCANDSMTVRLKSDSSLFFGYYAFYGCEDTFPVDGSYSRIESPSMTGSYLTESGYSGAVTWYYSAGSSFGGAKGAAFRSSYDRPTDSQTNSISRAVFAQLKFYAPVYKVTPFSPLSDSTYSTTTRPTSISGGNYGIVGDNNQITKVEDNSSIVNETNNTYYNPATGQTAPITNWSYDYSDRSYKLTLDGGKTSSVTYGDENITITETIVNESGDTITNNYTIYYLAENFGSETPPCAHEWVQTSSTDPTCTVPGSKLSTCSKCQQTRKEVIPALGHDWQVKQSVTTEYDETGQLIQQGYTIFQCSRCQEQYKSTDGTIPPGGSSGTDPGEDGETIWDKLGKLLGTAIKALLDLLGSAVDTVLGGLIDLITNLVENLKQLVDLFGSVGEAFQVLWTWLPPEVTAILVAGVSIFVFVALLKFFMK